jgi:hypothetical protein
MALADFIRVQKYLGGIRYPATRQQLIDHARANHADADALAALAAMPDRVYHSPDEISQVVA